MAEQNVKIKVEADTSGASDGIKRIKRDMDDLGASTSKTSNEQKKLKDAAQTSADEIRRAYDAINKKTQDISNGLGKTASSFSQMAAVASGSIAGISFGILLNQLHQVGMAVESMRGAYTAVFGEQGKNQLAFITKLTGELGLSLQAVTASYLKLAAASKGTSLEGQGTKDIFIAVTKASRALALSTEQTDGALLAISQMMSKGTVQAEELRGQLGERLPGAFQIAARAMGVTTAELGKMLEGGKVIADDFLPKFAAELEKTFQPGAEQLRGLTAETTRLKTAWFDLNKTVMESGGEGVFAFLIRGARSFLEEKKEIIKGLREIKNEAKWFAETYSGNKKYDTSGFSKVDLSGMMNAAENPLTQALFGTLTPDLGVMTRRSTEDFASKLKRDNLPEDSKPGKSEKSTVSGTESESMAQMKRSLELSKQYNALLLDAETDSFKKGKIGYEAYFSDRLLIAEDNYQNEIDLIDSRQAEIKATLATSKDKELNTRLTGNIAELNDQKTKAALLLEQIKQDAAQEIETYSWKLDAKQQLELDANVAASARRVAELELEKNSALAQLEINAMISAANGEEHETALLRLAQEMEATIYKYAMETDSFETYLKRKAAIEAIYTKKAEDLEASQASKKRQLAASTFGSLATIADAFYELSGKKSKEAFYAYQALKSGEIVISTADAAMKAYSSAGNPYLGAILAAGVVAAGAVQLAAVWGASPDGTSSVTSSATTASATTALPSQATAEPSQAPAGALNIHIYGNVVDHDKFSRELMPSIQKALRDGDSFAFA